MIKGVQTLFPLFRHYAHADLLIAGTGIYETELRRQAQDIPSVHFLGSLDSVELRNVYRHAIAVIVPSLCYEVFGNVPVEASQLGTPVIARDLGALSETVESQGGILYRSSEELLSAMERLHANSALRREMGETGHQAYLDRWSEEAHLKMYFQLLKETAMRKWEDVPWQWPARQSLAFPTPTRI